MSAKIYLDINVLQAAQKRITYIFDNFPKIYISFSGGKDSTVMTHLVMEEAIKRKKKVGLLLVDLEGQYKHTIDHALEICNTYKQYLDIYWICLPISLQNCVSVYEPKWMCWEDGKEWIRQPPDIAITNIDYFPFFKTGMEFEEFVPLFGHWYSQGQLASCFVGIRSDESLNRYRTIKSQKKTKFENKQWTTWIGKALYNAYPIYDWKTQDIWIYCGKYYKSYNKIYDLMYKAGLTIHQSRLCQPYGYDQRKGLWLFHILEPETWSKIVARVNGANSGSNFVKYSGNVSGQIKITKPPGHTWESFVMLLLASLPEETSEHYKNKITVFLNWWANKGYSKIPDEADKKLEANREIPSWRRIAKSILRNDWWCKGLSFSQTKSTSYEKYKKYMKQKRQRLGVMI